MRLDSLLKALCLVKTRSQGKRGCETGRVRLNGLEAKPSREVHAGDLVEISYPERTLVIEIVEVPARQVPRSRAADCYRVVRETRTERGRDV